MADGILTTISQSAFVERKCNALLLGATQPPLSSTGVLWVSCWDPRVLHRVQDDTISESQPFLVCLGAVDWFVLFVSDSKVRSSSMRSPFPDHSHWSSDEGF